MQRGLLSASSSRRGYPRASLTHRTGAPTAEPGGGGAGGAPVPDTHPAERLCGKPCVLVSCLRQITTTRGFKQQTGSLSQVAEVQTQDAGGSVPWEALGESRPPVSWMSRGAASAPRVQGLPSSLRPCFPGVLPLRVSAGSGSCRPPTRTSAVGLRAL